MSNLSSFKLLSFLFTTKNFIFLLLFTPAFIYSQPVDQTYSTQGTFTYSIPPKYSANITVYVFGGGGGGGTFGISTNNSAGGGGGGGYTTLTYLNVPAGDFTVIVGAGGAAATNGGPSSFSRAGYTTLTANGGVGGSSVNTTGGSGGTATGGSTNNPGGKGGDGGNNNDGGAGGGASGSSAGTGAGGVNAPGGTTGSAGGSASGSGNGAGGAGGKGSDNATANAGSGTAPGGGGGGRSDNQNSVGVGGNGRVIVAVITVLPIQLLSFDVIKGKNPILNWTTLSELNNDHFSLERSRDGKDFKEITRVDGQGTSDKRNDYSFIDLTPFHGVNYYKLKQVDFDGIEMSFPIRSVVVESNDISIYPTMVHDLITLDLPNSDQETLWMITNMVGFKHGHGIIKAGLLESQLSLADIPKGAYIMTLSSKNIVQSFKLVKL